MSKLEILGGKLYSNELFSPGYVWFRCADYGGLPDNTTGKTGYHVVYRPLCADMGYAGHEHVTEAMRADVRALYDHEKAVAEKAEQDRHERVRRAWEVMEAIPHAAVLELRAINRQEVAHFKGINEGGEGFIRQHDWASKAGVEILQRHGVDAGAIASAEEILIRDDIH